MSEQLEQYRASAAPGPARVSQATAVEQSRAVAEVAAAVQVAQAYPRDESRALAAMRAATDRWRLADAAQFSFRRAGENITGPTVQLARELARVWGNVQYGIVELDRDFLGGRSEMLAWAWDVQTNTRASTSFIVEHVREAKGTRKPLTSDRDVYDNNANMGARRVREQLFSVLPRWFTDEAVERCADRLKRDRNGDPIPFAQRLLNLEAAFAEIRVSRGQLEDRQGPAARWTDLDLAALGVLFRTLQRGETTVAEEFGTAVAPVTVAEVARPAPAAERAAAGLDPAEPSDEEWSRIQAEKDARGGDHG